MKTEHKSTLAHIALLTVAFLAIASFIAIMPKAQTYSQYYNEVNQVRLSVPATTLTASIPLSYSHYQVIVNITGMTAADTPYLKFNSVSAYHYENSGTNGFSGGSCGSEDYYFPTPSNILELGCSSSYGSGLLYQGSGFFIVNVVRGSPNLLTNSGTEIDNPISYGSMTFTGSGAFTAASITSVTVGLLNGSKLSAGTAIIVVGYP